MKGLKFVKKCDIIGLKTGKNYSFYVVRRAKGVNDERSNTKVIKTSLKGNLDLSFYTENFNETHVLEWNKIAGATRYIIYRKQQGGSYKKIITIGENKIEFDTTKLKPYVYSYIVRAGRYDSIDRVMTDKSNEVKYDCFKIKQVSLTLSAKSGVVTVKINPIENADGYEIYRSNSKSGSYKRVKKTTKTSWKDTTLTDFNRKYYYKTRTYRIENGDTFYSSYGAYKGLVVRK